MGVGFHRGVKRDQAYMVVWGLSGIREEQQSWEDAGQASLYPTVCSCQPWRVVYTRITHRRKAGGGVLDRQKEV